MKATVISLSDSTRELFKKMSFPEIPEEAKYIAFGEEGEAVFLSQLDTSQQFAMPRMTAFIYYDVDNLEVE